MSIGLDGVTVSFSVEDRGASGRKLSAFNSLRGVRCDGKSNTWTPDEMQIVLCSLSKKVIRATFRDAVHRGILSAKTAVEEVRAIHAAYDKTIIKLLRGSDEIEG